MSQFDDLFLEVVELADPADLGYSHFRFEHETDELLPRKQSHHGTL